MPDAAGGQPRSQTFIDVVAALLVTAAMGALSWYLAGAPGTNGIDDAAITRSYSQNIANGYGFVYNIGGERVEGATSLLWTAVLVIPYLFDDNPEIPILALTATFSFLSIFWGLQVLKRAVAPEYGSIARILMLLGLAGLPGYFIWSIWSMMEIALWSAICMLTVDRLSRLAEAQSKPANVDALLLIAAVAAPLTRPEGVAIFVGLAVLTLLLRMRAWRPVASAIVLSLVTFGLIAAFRLAYFGFLFPNTYYAKVSSDRLQNIKDGSKYLASFVTEQPFGGLLVASWILLALIALMAVFRGQGGTGSRTRVIASAFVLGILTVYVLLGGDHFALWRFYQPIMPLFTLPLILFPVWLVALSRKAGHVAKSPAAALAVVALFLWTSINALSYYQDRFDVAKEYALSWRGEVFGRYLNTFEPLPVIGVGAAGGIALTYDGEIRDLLGLNWVEMAHAKPIKVGKRNHASFDSDTFWKHSPEVLPQFDRIECQRTNWTEELSRTDAGVKEVFGQTKFQEQYSPVIFEMGDGNCANGFALNDWLEKTDDERLIVKSWEELTILYR